MNKIVLITAAVALGCTLTTGCAAKSNQLTSVPQNNTAVTQPNQSSASNLISNVTTQNASSNEGNSQVSTGTISNTQLIKESMQLAETGKVIHISFVAGHSNIDEAKSAWGEPSNENAAGAGIYDAYNAQHAALGFNKGGQIFDVRSFSSELQSITLSEVKQVLGTPGSVRQFKGDSIFMYPAGRDFQLLWIFPTPSSSNPNPHLDHISVFCPASTVNIMAQNQPAPSVVIDQTPGSVGSLFTFTITNAPKGYTLSEFEWVGSNGKDIVNTLQQAVDNGASGAGIPGFEVSGDGKTLSFDYTSAMKKQSGTVRLIYQNTNGAAMVGESSPIELK